MYLLKQLDKRLCSWILRFSFRRRNRTEPPHPRVWSTGDRGKVRGGTGDGPSGLSHNLSCRVSVLWFIAAHSGLAGAADHFRKTPPASPLSVTQLPPTRPPTLSTFQHVSSRLGPTRAAQQHRVQVVYTLGQDPITGPWPMPTVPVPPPPSPFKLSPPCVSVCQISWPESIYRDTSKTEISALYFWRSRIQIAFFFTALIWFLELLAGLLKSSAWAVLFKIYLFSNWQLLREPSRPGPLANGASAQLLLLLRLLSLQDLKK